MDPGWPLAASEEGPSSMSMGHWRALRPWKKKKKKKIRSREREREEKQGGRSRRGPHCTAVRILHDISFFSFYFTSDLFVSHRVYGVLEL